MVQFCVHFSNYNSLNNWRDSSYFISIRPHDSHENGYNNPKHVLIIITLCCMSVISAGLEKWIHFVPTGYCKTYQLIATENVCEKFVQNKGSESLYWRRIRGGIFVFYSTYRSTR